MQRVQSTPPPHSMRPLAPAMSYTPCLTKENSPSLTWGRSDSGLGVVGAQHASPAGSVHAHTPLSWRSPYFIRSTNVFRSRWPAGNRAVHSSAGSFGPRSPRAHSGHTALVHAGNRQFPRHRQWGFSCFSGHRQSGLYWAYAVKMLL